MAREITKRVERTPLFQRGPQSIAGTKDADYEYRFVNDTGSRIANFQQAGYEIVSDLDLVVGDSRVSDATSVGSGKYVTSNDGTVSYLMRIKKEWFNEDQKAKAARIAETERAMNKDSASDYGTVKVSRD